MKRTVSVAKNSKSNGSSTKSHAKAGSPQVPVAVCLHSDENAELHPRKLYRLLPDDAAVGEGYMRIVDDSGEDYLYPADWFAVVQVPAAVAKALLLK